MTTTRTTTAFRKVTAGHYRNDETGIEITKTPREALRDAAAREWYATAGRREDLTRAEVAAGYADWDRGGASPRERLAAYAAADGYQTWASHAVEHGPAEAIERAHEAALDEDGQGDQDARADRNVGAYAQQYDRWVREHNAYTPRARMRATEEQAYVEYAALRAELARWSAGRHPYVVVALAAGEAAASVALDGDTIDVGPVVVGDLVPPAGPLGPVASTGNGKTEGLRDLARDDEQGRRDVQWSEWLDRCNRHPVYAANRAVFSDGTSMMRAGWACVADDEAEAHIENDRREIAAGPVRLGDLDVTAAVVDAWRADWRRGAVGSLPAIQAIMRATGAEFVGATELLHADSTADLV